MGIDLGLRRVATLLGHLGNPHKSWYSVHVAGTNGKGSVCAYITSVLLAANIRSGRFTSPHFVHRRDSISIDGHTVSEADFNSADARVRAADKQHAVNATEFELLTATAFEIFSNKRVQVAVVEVGLGGRLDATNVLESATVELPSLSSSESGLKHATPLPIDRFESDSKNKKCGVLATVITKIGLDHQSFLGDTLAKIAYQKAGIIKKGVPCIVDGSNEEETLNTISQVSAEENIGEEDKEHMSLLAKQPMLIKAFATVKDNETAFIETKSWGSIDTNITPLLGEYQRANLACSIKALEVLQNWFPEQLGDLNTIEAGIRKTQWPGRLQWLDISNGSADPIKILLDGAHNPQAADELALFLDKYVRPNTQNNSIHFVIAFTSGKDYGEIISRVVKPGDSVVTTEFAEIDGMPWIHSYSAKETAEMVASTVKDVSVKAVKAEDMKHSQLEAIKQSNAEMLRSNGKQKDPVVVMGSLYLAGKILEKVTNAS